MIKVKLLRVLGLIFAMMASGSVYAAKTDPPILVATPTVTGITTLTATLGGEITSQGTDPIEARGIEWDTVSGGTGGTYANSVTEGGTAISAFSVTDVSGLPANPTTIYFRAWARNTGNGSNTGYSDEASFALLSASGPPTLDTSTLLSLNAVTSSTATLGGNITGNGGDTITSRGTVWNTTGTPDIVTDSLNALEQSTSPTVEPFSHLRSSLNTGTQIFFRSYAVNGNGTGYGPDNSFYTEPAASPLSVTIDNVGDTGFTINWPSNPAGNGDGALVVVSTNAITAVPIDGTVHAFDSNYGTGGTDIGSSEFVVYRGTGATSVPVTGLTASITYNVAVFYSAGTGAGEIGINYRQTSPATSSQLTNTPAVAPTLSPTTTFASVTATTAVLSGTMTLDGGAPVVCGVEWDIDGPGAAPYANSQTWVNHPLPCTENISFDANVTGLPPGDTIYFRAYATNSAGTGFSSEANFPTPAALPTVDTPSLGAISATSAFLGGNVFNTGGASIDGGGIVWSTFNPPQSQDPADKTTVPMTLGTGTGSFSEEVFSLPTGTLVYFQAYATNSAGTAYSAVGTPFTPAGPPEMADPPPVATVITHNSAILGGQITSDGGSQVLARGTVWNTAGAPNIVTDSLNALAEGGTSVGVPFSHNRTGLPSGTTIYYRSYATNSSGTGYSLNDRPVDILSEPTVQASNITFPRVAGRSMRISWTRGNGDGSIVVLRSTLTTPTLVDPVDGIDYAATSDYSIPPPETSGGSQNFVVHKGPENFVWVTGLTLNTSYSVAIYEYAGTGGSTDYRQLSPEEDVRVTTTVPVHNEDNRADCSGCHYHGQWMSRDTALRDVCVTCHKPGGTAAAKLEFDNHLTPGQNPNVDFVDCGVCHELHNPGGANTTQSTHPITATIALNKAFLRANVDKYVPNAATPANLHGGDSLPENTDIPQVMDGETVLVPADTPNRAIEGGDETTARGYCQVCHTYTKYHRSTGTAIGQLLPDGSNSANHPGWPLSEGDPRCHDGTSLYDPLADCGENLVGGTPTLNPGFQTQCGKCHEHNNQFQGSGGDVSCIICHAPLGAGTTGPYSRPSITDQLELARSHIPNGVAAEPDCLVCHDQTGHATDAIVGVIDLDTGAISNQPNAGASTIAPAEAEAFTPLCMSCHDDASADQLADTGDQTKTSPFIGSVPATFAARIIDETGWTNAGHNRPASGSPSGTWGPNPVTCLGDGTTGCHASAHGTDTQSLLANVPALPATPDFTAFCLTCHDGDGPSSKDIEAQFNTATNFRAVSGISGAFVNQRHDVSNVPDDTVYPNYTDGDQTYSGGGVTTPTVLTCNDCHSPHVDNASNTVADPDTALPLATYDITNTYTDDGKNIDYDSTGTLDPINPQGSAGGFSEPDYIQFCLTCHDGTAPAGVTMNTADPLADIGDHYVTDYHGAGAGSGQGTSLNKGGMKAPWVTTVGEDPIGFYAAMNCTTCHGAHGSPNIFNLRSSITVAGVQMEIGGTGNMPVPARITDPKVYDLPRTDETVRNSGIFIQEDHSWGAWCSFCHDMSAHAGKTEVDTCQGAHEHGGGSF